MNWFFIFVRQDISLAQQIIQTNHATLEMAAADVKLGETPNSVLIGVRDETELQNVINHLENSGIKHVAFVDNDFDFKKAAVVTVPLDIKQKQVLRGYSLYKP